MAILQGTGVFSNRLSGFTVGDSYRVTFAAAQRASNVAGQTWMLTVNGSAIGSFAPVQEATNYVDYTAVFTAAQASNTLAFVGSNLNGGDNTVLIDRVRVDNLHPPGVDNAEGGVNVAVGVTQLQGTLTNGPADVQICWGLTDGGTDGPWANTNQLPGLSGGAFACTVSNLLYGVPYYYRCRAANAQAVTWATGSTSFVTWKPGPGALLVTNGLALWLDASLTNAMTLTGTTVSEWRDRMNSGGQRKCRPATAVFATAGGDTVNTRAGRGLFAIFWAVCQRRCLEKVKGGRW